MKRNSHGILSAPGDILRVFELETQQELMRATLDETVRSLDFTRDGTGLAFLTGWRTLSLEHLPLQPQKLIDDACSRVTRNLRPREWERYFGAEPPRDTCPVLNPAAAALH
ncbi:hypothetical protein PO002_27585 [Cupriavidus necator]|uniref:hypothetical protein n=1 Tax=Cupriavidus necator TaxID=106590 RepID=UPI0039C1E57B